MTGRDLHQKASMVRETGGDLAESLKISDEALITYFEAKDLQGASELLADRSITFRHLNQKTGEKGYLFLAKAELQASIEIAKLSGIPDAITLPVFQLANVEEGLENYPAAIELYKQAIAGVKVVPGDKVNPTNPAYNRPAVLPNMQVHLEYCVYKNGDKAAAKRMLESLHELEQASEADISTKNVWVSGGYMSMAEMLRTDDPVSAKQYLNKAKEFITEDPRLTPRLKQWEKLVKSFA